MRCSLGSRIRSSKRCATASNSILGFSQYLADESVSAPERQEYAGAIRRNGDHMIASINEVLDSAKIEAGMMRVELVEMSLVEIVRDVQTVLQARAEAKGLAMELHWPAKLPDPVLGDPVRVRQVLLNLRGNAVKLTEKGKICIEVQHQQRPSGDRLQVRVVGTGKGMTPEQLERLFQPFVQGDDSVARQHGGTGLGLSISKQLAQRLGGDLYAECLIAKACGFVLDLPLRSAKRTRSVDPALGATKAGAPAVTRLVPRLVGQRAARGPGQGDGGGQQRLPVEADRARTVLRDVCAVAARPGGSSGGGRTAAPQPSVGCRHPPAGRGQRSTGNAASASPARAVAWSIWESAPVHHARNRRNPPVPPQDRKSVV